ncbi:MAG: MlaD family protein [Dokdonella sp.]|uniref:MlaD family protein n=1 Tax=Dokdonella sp. TaxID=2291710 RepID=UPI002C25F653|nr:MCE family protein [Xanthomonadales bacterium]HQV72054.1 MlaD family protein [Dokdonella sp.]HQW75352.1 MlaD family protein [Dokdonella sp.]
MKRDTINYVAVGAVVLAALVLLLVGLALITGRSGAATDYFVHYRNVTGLRYGAPVFYEGYRIGEVAAIEPERSSEGTRYKVTVSVKRDWTIPVDSVARLQSSGLLADMSIGIKEGASKQMLARGAEIGGAENADVFAAVGELAGQVSALTREQITPMIALLSKRVDSITGSLDNNTPEILGQAQTLLGKLNDASGALDDLLKPQNRAAVASILGNVQGLSGELRETRKTLDQTVGELADIARENRGDIRGAMTDLATVMASLSSRMDVITHHLESATRNLDEFSREIRRNPGQLLRSPEPDKLEDDGK